jgi:hypothetical protein
LVPRALLTVRILNGLRMAANEKLTDLGGAAEPIEESAPLAAQRNRGWFTAESGRAASLKSGIYTRPEKNPALVLEMNARATEILGDLGGNDSAAYVLASQVRSYVRLELLEESGFAHLARALAAGGRGNPADGDGASHVADTARSPAA